MAYAQSPWKNVLWSQAPLPTQNKDDGIRKVGTLM
jgi:hypothetical protein